MQELAASVAYTKRQLHVMCLVFALVGGGFGVFLSIAEFVSTSPVYYGSLGAFILLLTICCVLYCQQDPFDVSRRFNLRGTKRFYKVVYVVYGMLAVADIAVACIA